MIAIAAFEVIGKDKRGVRLREFQERHQCTLEGVACTAQKLIDSADGEDRGRNRWKATRVHREKRGRAKEYTPVANKTARTSNSLRSIARVANQWNLSSSTTESPQRFVQKILSKLFLTVGELERTFVFFFPIRPPHPCFLAEMTSVFAYGDVKVEEYHKVTGVVHRTWTVKQAGLRLEDDFDAPDPVLIVPHKPKELELKVYKEWR